MDQKLIELVEESQEHLAANDISRAHYKCLATIAAESLEVSDVKLASDLNYYRGGWPNEDTPPLTETIGRKFASAIRMLAWGGDPEVYQAFLAEFKKHGITITVDEVVGTNALSERALEKIAAKMERYGSNADVEMALEKAGGVAASELARHVIKSCNRLQKEICENADAVKIEKGDLAEAAGIPRANLILAARTKRRLDRIEDESRRKELSETLVEQANTRLEIVEGVIE